MEKIAEELTPEERFVQLYNEGLVADQIADRMGISRSAVFRLRRKTGMPRWAKWTVKPLTEIPPEELRALFEANMTQREIAEHFDVSTDVIKRRARKYSLMRPAKTRKTFTSEWNVESIRAMIEVEELRTIEIAERMGCSREAVLNFVKRHGLPWPKSNRAVGRPPRVDRELIRTLTEEGYPIAYIADAVGCSRATVSRVRTDLGIQREQAAIPYPPELRVKALEMLEGGASYTETCETLKISRVALTRWYPGMGWTASQTAEYRHMLKQFEKVGVDTARVDW